ASGRSTSAGRRCPRSSGARPTTTWRASTPYPTPRPQDEEAAMSQTVFLDELTEPEVAERIAAGKNFLLVPTGSTEQHGPHGPLGTDVIIPREVCRRVALDRDALVAPPVPYGLAAGHRGFAGLAYLSAQTYLALIEDLIHSFVESGFRR